jgi:all-trans-retinol 13,14-reductase
MMAVEVNHSEKFEGKNFISNIHPKTMMHLMGNAPIRPAYRKRITSIGDTYGVFSLYLAMKANTFEYINSNYYVFKSRNVWDVRRYFPDELPKGYMMHISPGSKSSKYADAVIVNSYMNWNEVKPWDHTRVGQRGETTRHSRQKAENPRTAEMDFPESEKGISIILPPDIPRLYWHIQRFNIRNSERLQQSDENHDFATNQPCPIYFTDKNINVHGVWVSLF